MEIKKAHRKSFDVEYVEVTEENMNDVAKWSGGVVGEQDGVRFVKFADKNAINNRQTKAFVGDLVVHHLETKGFKSFGKKAFSKSFDEVTTWQQAPDEHVAHRSAVTGQYVAEEYAEKHPDITVSETS